MPYFQDPQGGLHYLSDADIAASGESILCAGCVAITDVQAQAIQNQPMTLAEAQVVLTAAVQTWLDTTAQASGYDSIALCASYINSGVEQWAADATAAIAWRDAVWQAYFTQWSAAKSEINPVIPTAAALIAGLPQPSTHGWTVHAPRF